MKLMLMFNAAEANAAQEEWGANCGPMSLAAALALDLPTVRQLLAPVGFEGKGYTNPTMLEAALTRAGINFTRKTGLYTSALAEGISRIQWEGPWLKKGVPFGVAYRHTHWVAHCQGKVLCTATGLINWLPIAEWRDLVGKVCREEIPHCTGWHATHHYTFEVLAKEVR
jgi:hypothetical protein